MCELRCVHIVSFVDVDAWDIYVVEMICVVCAFMGAVGTKSMDFNSSQIVLRLDDQCMRNVSGRQLVQSNVSVHV